MEFANAVGRDKDLRNRIYVKKARSKWSQEEPNYLKVSNIGKPTQILSRGRDELYPLAAKNSHIPSGHPEGYFEAFANVYSAFTNALIKKNAGETLPDDDLDFPTVLQGIDGVKFIGKCVECSQKGAAWLEF
jgi:hypothetical protein